MVTYGRPETAEQNPRNEMLRIARAEVAKLEAACTHHFVPQRPVEKLLPATLVPGVYNAGNFGETGDTSHLVVPLECTRCGAEDNPSVAKRCPVCASEMRRGRMAPPGTHPQQYFGPDDHDFYAVWLIECPCGFKGAGLLYDR